MFTFKFCLFITLLLSFVAYTLASGNENAISDLKHFHESYISRKGFGVRQELDEDLCLSQMNLTTNPFLFTDATGKIPAGILLGNLNHFGQYEQCLSVDEIVEDVHIKGKYCMMRVTLSIDEDAEIDSIPEMSLSGLFGVCVANACEATDLGQNFSGIYITSEELFCREANDKPMEVQDIIAIVLFSILGLLVILSTGYHLTRKLLFNEDVSKIAKSFSVHHNMTRLTNIPKSGNPLSCINGIRAVSMIWVVVGHTYLSSLMAVMENPLAVLTWLTSVQATKITAATLAVDTFLYMAAFLLTWSVLKKFKNPVSFTKSVPFLYLSRYLRLTPALAAVILLQVSFFNHVSDGPDWRPVFSPKEACMESWWVNLLYLQNYLRPTTMCLQHSWYLAVDMQLYLAAPILIVFLFRTIKYAIASLTVVSLASMGAALGYCLYFNFGVVTEIMTLDSVFMARYYGNTIPRSPPFVFGIVVAYVIFTLKKRNVTINKKPYVIFHWIITAILLVLPVYGTYATMQHGNTQTAINFFNAWHRPAWALGVGGVIVASMHGFAGPVGWFLSLDMWTVPARLSYMMYLIHFPIMFSIVGSQTSPRWFSDSSMLFRFLSDLSLTVLAALLLNIIVEAPFAEICNILFAKLLGTRKDDADGKSKLDSKDKDESPSSQVDGKEKNGVSSISLEVRNEKSIVNPGRYHQFSDDTLVSATNIDFKKAEHGRS